MKQKLDPIVFATLANRMDSIVVEVMLNCVQSARSSVIQARDFSMSIADRRCRLISIAEGLPIHVITSTMAVEPIPQLFDDIAPGDCFLNNCPYYGNSHHADYTFCTPVFYQGQLIFWVILRAHQADTGAPVPTTYLPFAREIYEEGLHWPCVRVQRNYKDIEDVVRIGKVRIRVPEQFYGDFAACVGATRVGERRLTDLVEKYGLEATEQFIEEWIDYGSRRMVEEIKRLPQGTWENQTTMDPLPFAPQGIPLKIKLTIDHRQEAMIVDLTENPDQFAAGINLSEAMSKAGVMEGIFWCLDPTLPHNSGAFEHVHFQLREGSIAGIPRFPTGTSVATTFTADRLASCTIALMAKVDPHQGGAEGGYVSWNFPVLSGEDPRYGHAPYVNQMILAEGAGGGGPAVKGYDGWLTWGIGAVMGGLWSTSAELWEKAQPQLIECGEIVPDSGGAGEYCGSPGVRIVVRARQAPFIAAGFGDGQVFPPQGILDGEPGGPNQGFILDERGERVQKLPLIGLFEIQAGHALEGITNGGGGFGDPLDRDPEQVRQDVRKGWVSVKKARETFGVVLDMEPEEFAVDYAATRKLREEKKRLKKRTPVVP